MNTITTQPTNVEMVSPTINVLPTAKETPYISSSVQPPTPGTELLTPSLSTPIVEETFATPVISKCLEILNYSNQVVSIDGNLLVREDSGDQRTLLWNVKNGEFISPTLKTDNIVVDFRISVNGQWLSYLSFRKSLAGGDLSPWLVIMSADGKEIRSINGQGWIGLVRWLDNDRLLIRGGSGNIIPLIVLNPFTQESQILQPDFPDILDFPIFREWAEGTETVYDPSLSRVVFPNNKGMALMDVMSKNVIGQINPIVVDNAVPKWSPDGQRFVFSNATRFIKQPDKVSNYELFIMDRNGNISQLTNLNSFFADTMILPLYNWSPNGRYIAFYLGYWKNQQFSSTWAVYDTQMNRTTIYCIKPYSETISAPVWSPIKDQFLVEAENPQNRDNRVLILIDVEKNLSVMLSEGKIPYGWMVLP